MENEIEVGEYIRTELGDIIKITEGFEFIIKRHNESDNKIVKHSFDLIDIIEEGDYVNGHKVIDASDTNKGCMREVYCEDDEDFGIWDEMIKTVVTKEQFENISYKVEKE